MNSLRFICLIIFLSFVFAGCGFLNPYNSEFSCPEADKGKCAPIKSVYQEDLQNTDLKRTTENTLKPPSSNLYHKELYEKLAAMLKKPKTPIVSAPKVVRVLFMPYKGDSGELFMQRYVYLMIDNPKWVMGEYLTDD